MSIGSRIKVARKEKNMTQEQLALQCGVTKGAISNYENDVSTPDVEKLSAIMDCLGVDPNYIYQDFFFPTKSTPTPPVGEARMLTEQELKRISSAMAQMNQEGRERAVELVEDLAAGGRYKKTGTNNLGKEA